MKELLLDVRQYLWSVCDPIAKKIMSHPDFAFSLKKIFLYSPLAWRQWSKCTQKICQENYARSNANSLYFRFFCLLEILNNPLMKARIHYYPLSTTDLPAAKMKMIRYTWTVQWWWKMRLFICIILNRILLPS